MGTHGFRGHAVYRRCSDGVSVGGRGGRRQLIGVRRDGNALAGEKTVEGVTNKHGASHAGTASASKAATSEGCRARQYPSPSRKLLRRTLWRSRQQCSLLHCLLFLSPHHAIGLNSFSPKLFQQHLPSFFSFLLFSFPLLFHSLASSVSQPCLI